MMDKDEKMEKLSNKEMIRLMNMSECAMFTAMQGADIELLFANKKFYSILQYTEQEFEEKFHNCLMAVIIPEEKQKIRALIARQMAVGGTMHLEFRILRKDGAMRWLSVTAKAFVSERQLVYYCSCTDITQHKRALEDVYNAKKELDVITNSIPGGVIKLRTSDFSILYANDGFYRLSGYSRTEYSSLFGNQCNRLIHPDDQKMVQNIVNASVTNRGLLGVEYRIISKTGEIRWSYASGYRVDDQDGEPVYLCIIMDITARKQLEEKMNDNFTRSQLLLEYTKETLWTYVIGEKTLYRSGFLKGSYSENDVLSNCHYEQIVADIVHPDDVADAIRCIEERCKHVGESKGIYHMRDAAGHYQAAEISLISYAPDNGDTPEKIYGKTRLINESELLQKAESGESRNSVSSVNKIVHMAEVASAKYEDDITVLLPYAEWLKQCRELLEERTQDRHYGVICCDINGFQKINYQYGVSVGNEILCNFAEILKENLSEDGIATRVNADYFLAVFSYEKHNDLIKTMSRLLRRQNEVEDLHNYMTYGSTSGIYLIQPDDNNIDDIVTKADLARRSIKGTKGNHYAIYTEELQKAQFCDEAIISQIIDAMAKHTIEINYIPRIQGGKERVIGSKAIPRIQDKNGDYITLEDLRRYIDRNETIQKLVFYVLSSVCCSQGVWKKKGLKILPIAIDITPGQLCLKQAVDEIDKIVKKNDLTPEDILFEIQEPFFNETTSSFEMALAKLSKLGYSVHISRFGSSHTAVDALCRLPVSGIKFHGGFFKKNMERERERLMMQKIVEMAKELGMDVSCGGIETELQEEIARSLGCDIFEGEMYYGLVRNEIYERCFLESKE